MARGFFSNNFLCKLMGLGKHSRINIHENHENQRFHGKLDFFTISSYMLSSNKTPCRSRFSYLKRAQSPVSGQKSRVLVSNGRFREFRSRIQNHENHGFDGKYQICPNPSYILSKHKNRCRFRFLRLK